MKKIKKLYCYRSLDYFQTERASQILTYKIMKDYQPDLLVFIARGGYSIAKTMKEELQLPLIDVDCSSSSKKQVERLSQYLPEHLKRTIRTYRVTKKNPYLPFTKNIKYAEEEWRKHQDKKKILLVDDVVETGATLEHVLPVLKRYFKDAEIRVATLSNFNHAWVDYELYHNCILSGPWARDSKDYNLFIEDYENYQKSKVKER